jgi:hypothetical protein
MTGNATAYYLWPAVWVGDARPEPGAQLDVRTLAEEVRRRRLSSGVSVKVLREGMFIFDFSDWPPGRTPSGDVTADIEAWSRLTACRTQVLNAHLACLYTAMFRRHGWVVEKMLVTPADLIKLESLDGQDMAFNDNRVAWLALSRFPSTYAQHISPRFDLRLQSRGVLVHREAVEDSLELLATILEHENEDALLLVDLLARSCKTFEEGHHSVCLTESWTVTEKALNLMWSRFLDENRGRTVEVGGCSVPVIDKRRGEILEDHRSFTASVMAEVLCFANVLPHALYQGLSDVRKARNDWMHRLRAVSMQAARLSVRVAQEMLKVVEGIDLDVPLKPGLY